LDAVVLVVFVAGCGSRGLFQNDFFGGQQLYFIASAWATLRSNPHFHGIISHHILVMGVDVNSFSVMLPKTDPAAGPGARAVLRTCQSQGQPQTRTAQYLRLIPIRHSKFIIRYLKIP
jgi:hypothetical protein